MKKAYYLSSCDTCKRILKQINWSEELIDIKKDNIDSDTLNLLYDTHGSYEALFNKRARKFKDEVVKARIKTDEDYKQLILEEYTFLKRPVFIIDDKHFVGNSKAVVQAAEACYKKLCQ